MLRMKIGRYVEKTTVNLLNTPILGLHKCNLKMFTFAKTTVFTCAPRGKASATSVTSTSALNWEYVCI